MKKGFTLVELLAVIVILSVIAVITVPIVNNLLSGAHQQAYNENVEAIKNAAYDWTLLNTSLLPDNDNESIVVYLGELKLSGHIDKNIKNPLTGKLFSNNTSVVVTKNGDKYTFEVNTIDLDGTNNENSPLLIISGNIVDYVEVTQENIAYTVPSASAKDSDGNPISSSYISYQILKDEEVVSTVDTSALGVYTIKYSVTYNGNTGIYEKKVVVRDTTRPTLDVGSNITCYVDEIPDNLLDGVTVTDNSGETIIPEVRSEVENQEGIYYVYYTATDSSGNTITKRREVVVGNVVCDLELNTNYLYDYLDETNETRYYTFTAPCTGTYKLEVWGAQGGTSSGGYGGYSVGTSRLHEGDQLYVVVGGTTSSETGGYNGGGYGASGYYGGGGATHIAKQFGSYITLASYGNAATALDYVYIVAGGGGGASSSSYNVNGGNAGGYVGNSGGQSASSLQQLAGGGTQESGGVKGIGNFALGNDGSFGQGGYGAKFSAGGGGGWYGGGSSGVNGNIAGSGGGGSSYIGNDKLKNKKMLCYNCTEDKINESTYTETIDCVSATADSDCTKQGNGYAKITYVGN